MSLELILFCLGRFWASFWDPLGRLGSQGALPGVTLASLWLPWDSVGPFGAPWAPKGSLGSLWVQNGRPIPNGSQVTRLRTKYDLAELSGVSAGRRVTALWAQSGAGAAAPNPTSLAPGARMM